MGYMARICQSNEYIDVAQESHGSSSHKAFAISSVTGGASGRGDRSGIPLRSPPLRGRRRERLASSEMTAPTLRCRWTAIAFAAMRTSSSIANVVLISAALRISHHASPDQLAGFCKVDTEE
jgi:hypothetical protein